MTKGKRHDRDVWAPPTPKAEPGGAPALALSAFQRHFQDRLSHLGQDDGNVLAGALSTTTTTTGTAGGISRSSSPAAPRATAAVAKPSAGPSRRGPSPFTGFVTPDQVRAQKRTEVAQRQRPAPRTKLAPVSDARVVVPHAEEPSIHSTASDAVTTVVSATTVDNFLAQLRQQGEASSAPRAVPASAPSRTGPHDTTNSPPVPSPSPPLSTHLTEPPLKRRPNSGQRLVPLPVAPAVGATSSASARCDAGTSGATPPTAKPAEVSRQRWAAPQAHQTKRTKKLNSNTPAKPVIDHDAQTRPAGSNVLRLATPTPVRVQAPVAPTAAVENDAGTRRVSYRPYSIDDYHSLMDKVAQERRGGLGPSDTDAQRRARERLERQRAYGAHATKHALEVLKASAGAEEASEDGETRPESSPPREPPVAAASVSSNSSTGISPSTPHHYPSTPPGGQNGGGSGERRTRGSSASSSTKTHKKTKRKVLRQPTPEKVIQARERRQRALEYAREKAAAMAPPTAASPQAMDTEPHRHASQLDDKPPLSPAEKAALVREQRRLDLEAKHEQQRLAVEQIRRQLRA